MGFDSSDADADAGRPLPVGVGSRRWRTGVGASAQLCIRFDHGELAQLRRRADEQGVGVSVLARSYVRKGLAAPPSIQAWD